MPAMPRNGGHLVDHDRRAVRAARHDNDMAVVLAHLLERGHVDVGPAVAGDVAHRAGRSRCPSRPTRCE
jgi:hypothetical protein